MKKKLNIFGRKVPAFAILIALLVIGTASAAVFLNYATLTGTVNVSNGVSVSSGDETYDANGGFNVDFTDTVDFTINNGNDEPVIVNLVTSLRFSEDEETTWTTVYNYDGLTVDYSVIDGTGIVEATGDGTLVLVPPGGLTVEVEFDAADNAMPGVYKVTVVVGYSDDDYESFIGANSMEALELSYKSKVMSAPWTVLEGGKVNIKFAPMGNDFYYELSAHDLTPNADYFLIYYADKIDRFTNYGGNNPGAIISTSITTDNDGNIITIVDHPDLEMDLPHPDDANGWSAEYIEEYLPANGAKIWLVPVDSVNERFVPCTETSDPSASHLISSWDAELTFLYETRLIEYTDTNL